ncbi:AaceriACR170Cp [[Ashbya] aceris (nom. inval.)]|nr:AaceriACR170Cp [[Ashbya] aceris (nom. inval.)]
MLRVMGQHCGAVATPLRARIAPAALRMPALTRSAGVCRSYSSPAGSEMPKARGGRGKLLAVLGVLAAGTTFYSIMYQKAPPRELQETEDKSARPLPADTSVVFVLGGPGSGKGTQCSRLVERMQFVHVGAGDLLRDEQNRPGSQYGELIKHHIKEGLIVPQEVTVALLRRAIEEHYRAGKRKFLVDGFPRKMDQAITFEKSVVPSKFVLFFDCPERVMLERLLTRGQTSGRSDDNIESIKKRFRTYVETSMPVVEYFDKQQKVVRLSCDQPVEEVYKQVEAAVKDRLGLQ